MRDLNMLIVGVGGQGTLLASVLLGGLAMQNNLDVKLSEVHGMAQRGGSVVTHVRMSETGVAAPVVGLGGADVILAFELLEAYRYLPYLKPDGVIYVNTQRILPMPVIIGAQQYPEEIQAVLESTASKVVYLDALAVATELGNLKTVNVVMMGALSQALPFTQEQWVATIENYVKPQFVEINKKAFAQGVALSNGR